MKYTIEKEESGISGLGLSSTQLQNLRVNPLFMRRLRKQIVHAIVPTGEEVEVEVYFKDHKDEQKVFADPNYLDGLGLTSLQEIDILPR